MRSGIMHERSDDQGFTLTELLTVILIIGILSAIAVPVMLGQRRHAVDASLKNDLRVVVTELESYHSTAQTYPVASSADSTTVFPWVALSADNTVTVTVDSSTLDYCLVASAGGRASQDWVFKRSSGGMQDKGVTTC